MTAPAKELFANNAITTLSSGIDSSTTTVSVADGSVFPSTGNFRLIIDSEIMLTTARSGNNLTVTRGVEGTVAASHAGDSTVACLLTVGGFEQWAKDNVPLWGYSPALNKIVADNGTTVLVASDFTWVNQGTSTVSDQNGTILLRAQAAAGLNLRLQVRSAPSTPYAYIGAFQICGPRAGSDDSCLLWMGLRESSTGKLTAIAVGANSNGPSRLSVQNWTNATTFSAQARSDDHLCLIGNTIWLKVEDDGTNLKFHVGMDGSNWIQLLSVSRTAHMAGGPDQILWGAANQNNTGNENLVRLLHWSKE